MSPLLVLDLDGTLVDSIPDLLACANRMLARRDLAPLTPDELRPMVGDGVQALVERVLIRRKYRPDQSALTAFMADYSAHAADESRLFPGIAAMLDEARGRGWRLAVCTNKPAAAAWHLLTALGVAGQFDAIGGGDSFPSRKPDPGHLLGTAAMAGGEPARSLLVGDHRNDVAAAHGARMGCLFAGWGYGDEDMAEGAAGIVAEPEMVPDAAAALWERLAG